MDPNVKVSSNSHSTIHLKIYDSLDLNPCYTQSPPCQNNGVCVAGYNGAYTCTCTSQYTGLNCDSLICNYFLFNEK